MGVKTSDEIVISMLLSDTLKTNVFADLLPERQSVVLTDVEVILEQSDLLLPTKRRLMSYLTAIAADCRLTKEIKEQAVKLVEPWQNPGF